MTKKRRTKAEILSAQSKGLGDTVEKLFEVTGIAKAVKFIAGEDCGCDERKAKLNELFPYRKPNCLTEWEYQFLDEFFVKKTSIISPAEQIPLLKIYNRALNLKKEPTSCGSCWVEIIRQLELLYKSYANS